MPSGLRLFTAITFLLVSGCATQRIYLDETSVVITEVYYDPTAEQGKVEFIEIANLSGEPVDVSGWQVTGAGRVQLPSETRLGSGEAVVLSQDRDAFSRAFGSSVTPVAILTGKLKNGGENLRVEDAQGRVADETSYDRSVPEVEKAAGTGWSLHRVGYSITAASGTWRAASPTPGVLKAGGTNPR